jgi:hypothetical protein
MWKSASFLKSFRRERTEVAGSYQFAKQVNGKPAILSIGLWFEKESTVCDFQNLGSYNIIFYDSEAFSVPVEIGSAQFSFGASANMWEEGKNGVMELAGDLRRGETIKARVIYEDVYTLGLAPGVDSLPLKWDVEIDCPLRVRK